MPPQMSTQLGTEVVDHSVFIPSDAKVLKEFSIEQAKYFQLGRGLLHAATDALR